MTQFSTNQHTEINNSFHILLVEENVVSQAYITGLLGKLGHQVNAYTKGNIAADYFIKNQSSIDAIFLDLELDEPNAIHTLQILQQVQTPLPPIVTMYMDKTPELIQQIRSMGITCFQKKPLSLTILKKIMAKLENKLPAMTSQPLDLSRLYEVTNGDQEMENELVAIFLSQTPKILDQLKEAMEQNDWEQAKKEAHTLKGSAANLGANKLSALMKELEEELSSEQIESICFDKLHLANQELLSIDKFVSARKCDK